MKDHTTNPVLRNTPRYLLIRGLSLVGSKIFRADDRRACDEGWQISSRYGGLSRTYRDPRFDYLIRCAACSGRGCDSGGIACSACDGTGRIALAPAVASEPARGQP